MIKSNDDIHTLMKLLQKEQVLVCFTGPFSQNLLITIVDAIKASISAENNTPTLINKIFSAVVELTQNIMEYDLYIDAPRERLLFADGIVLVGKTNEGGYYVLSVNVVSSAIKERMIPYLAKLQSLDKTQLKALYFQKIRESSVEKNRGNIGLITIARNAESLVTDLLVENDDYSYLFIKANFK